MEKENLISSTISTIGFILLRHVNDNLTNRYWMYSYECIRKYYPEHQILIIDDNSDYQYITEIELYKTTIIQSEYPKRGELLPYYYYLHNKLFDIAIILHDSVFIHQYIDIPVEKIKTYKLLWDFYHDWDQIEDETRILTRFEDKELMEFYENKSLWKGCFGGMTMITHDYLSLVHNKYDVSKLLDCILNRSNRCSFERVIGCLLQKETPDEVIEPMFGNIHHYCHWGIGFHEKENYPHLPWLKVWTGR